MATPSDTTEQEQSNIGPRDLKEPGSPAWCWQTVSLLQNMWGSLDLNVVRYEEVWDAAEEHRIWERIPVEEPYGSLEVMQERLKVGDKAQARARTSDLIIRTKPLGRHGRPRNGSQDADQHLARGSGEYLAAVIKRDHPEVAARMERGEFTSVAEAARAAGIYREGPKKITASPDKEKLAGSLMKVYGVDGCRELVEVLQRVMEEAESTALEDQERPQ